MKAKFRLALLLFVLAATGTSACFAGAVAAEPQKIGIINIELAIIGSNEGQRDFAALQKRFEPKHNELQALNKEVDDLKKQLKGITSEQEGTLKIENLTPGNHHLRLTLPGYKEWNQNLTLAAGETLPVQAKLEPAGPKPLTEAEIMEALTNGMGNKRTAELVGKFGVDFTLTPEIKAKLRQAGADDKLLLEIATNKK